MKNLTFESIDESAIEEIIESNNPGTPIKISIGKSSPYLSLGILEVNKSLSNHDGYFQIELDTSDAARDRTGGEKDKFMEKLEGLSDEQGSDIKSGNCTEKKMRIDARNDGLKSALRMVLDTAMETNNHLE